MCLSLHFVPNLLICVNMSYKYHMEVSLTCYRVNVGNIINLTCHPRHNLYEGVVHNCQHLPISTESTNLGGGRGLRRASVLFLNVDLHVFVEHIRQINASKMY